MKEKKKEQSREKTERLLYYVVRGETKGVSSCTCASIVKIKFNFRTWNSLDYILTILSKNNLCNECRLSN